MWRESLPVAGPLDDDLIAGIGQPVQGAVSEDGVIEKAEPVKGGGKLGRWGVAAQDKCPAKCSA